MQSIILPRAAFAALAAVATSLVPAAASPAAAQIAPGSTLVFTGMADATELGSAGVRLEFAEPVTIDPSANSGSFASLTEMLRGATGSLETLTVGAGPQSITDFLRVGPYSFDLAYVPSGPYGQDDCYVAPAVGQRCTPFQLPGFELSPFYLENVASGGSDALFTALVSFDVEGTVRGGGATSAFSGTISATFEGLSYQEALAGLEQDGLRGVPFTGTFVAHSSVVPEPSTIALVATGLAGIAGAAWRRTGRRRR